MLELVVPPDNIRSLPPAVTTIGVDGPVFPHDLVASAMTIVAPFAGVVGSVIVKVPPLVSVNI